MKKSQTFKVFLVEDDPWYGQLLRHHMGMNPDYEVSLFTNGRDCLSQMHLHPDVVCIDYGLPDTTGEKLLTEIHRVNNLVPVVVISGQEEISVAVNLLKAGARDYIVKDDHTREMLWKSIIQIRENAALRQEVEVLREELEYKYDFEKNIIGQSPVLKKTFGLIEKAIRSNINVSITGETGTGKEVVAKAIHYNSDRKKKPFVAVNMAAIPKDLAESELFGHEKGAFTGAVAQKAGSFEAANGGTIFLDEIAELEMNLQSKLLRVIQEREVVRVGGQQTVALDVRIITATHKDLAEEVRKGRFREDLYFRIIGLPIALPPLRHRDKDVLVLAKHFLEAYAKDNKIKPPTLAADAKDKLMRYPFPGNVRELKAIIDLACVMCDGKEIQAEDITYHQVRSDDPFAGEEKTLRAYTADIISLFLKKYNHDVLEVARRLDIGKSTIYNMLKTGEIKTDK